ncbi:MAG: metallophosphoesterase [Bacteroidetes bacterium]|nr:metallophosphoesterase [Bacteroidota bacterium]
MVFGVLSDIHDNLANLATAIDKMKSHGVSEVIFCGDFCAPFAAKQLAESGFTVHAVFGNNDGDRFHIQKVTNGFANFHLYGEYIGDTENLLSIDGIRIGVTHYPFYAKSLAKTGWYDCVFYGHNHKADKQKFGNCLLMNPGEIAGVFGAPSYAIFNTELKSSEIVYF